MGNDEECRREGPPEMVGAWENTPTSVFISTCFLAMELTYVFNEFCIIQKLIVRLGSILLLGLNFSRPGIQVSRTWFSWSSVIASLSSVPIFLRRWGSLLELLLFFEFGSVLSREAKLRNAITQALFTHMFKKWVSRTEYWLYLPLIVMKQTWLEEHRKKPSELEPKNTEYEAQWF